MRQHLPAAFRIVFWAAIAVVLWSTLTDTGDLTGEVSDKVLHVVAFYGLAVLGRLAYPAARLAGLGLALAGLGGLIELLQGTPLIHRDASWGDVVADAAGVVCALAPVALDRFRRFIEGAP